MPERLAILTAKGAIAIIVMISRTDIVHEQTASSLRPSKLQPLRDQVRHPFHR
jgi:hypothetical protein